ncbi:MAG TPA: F0F1 ATP synthase subunit delta [Verrucomicrobiae bacterium]|nr:F0F1 ATP synthase subunit delta [Verrucomicrobiae bacterium]
MKAPRTRIAQVVADRTLAKGAPKRFVQELAAYLLAERRTGELSSIIRDVQADWAEAGQVEIVAASAHPLTAGVKADIVRRMKQVYPQAKSINVTEKHDPAVIGGVRLSLADRQLDLSVEAKLNQFKQLTATGNRGRK